MGRKINSGREFENYFGLPIPLPPSFEDFLISARTAIQPGGIPISEVALKRVHKEMFHDVYKDCGEYRQRPLLDQHKNEIGERPENIPQSMKLLCHQIRTDKVLWEGNFDMFVNNASKHFQRLEDIKPFEKGNDAIQHVLLKAMCHRRCHYVDIRLINGHYWSDGQRSKMTQPEYGPLVLTEQVIRRAIIDSERFRHLEFLATKGKTREAFRDASRSRKRSR